MALALALIVLGLGLGFGLEWSGLVNITVLSGGLGESGAQPSPPCLSHCIFTINKLSNVEHNTVNSSA